MKIVADERPRVKFSTAIVADDIRREANAKEFIIGVYTAKMVFAEIPPEFGVIIAISILFESPEVGQIPLQVRISGPNKEIPHQINGMISVTEPTLPKAIAAISVSGIPMLLQEEGNILIEARNYEDDEWDIVRVLPIVVNPDEPSLKVGNVTRMGSIVPVPPSQPQSAAPESSSLHAPSRRPRPVRRRRS